MNLLKEFEQYIKQQNLFNTKDKLLLAVSGGVDSVVLLALMDLFVVWPGMVVAVSSLSGVDVRPNQCK